MSDVGSLLGEEAGAYAEFRPDYPAALFDWLAANAPGHQRALDIVRGSGQASASLRHRLDELLSCDTCLPLLTAETLPTQTHRISCDARQPPRTEDYLDLSVVARALAWAAGSRFFREVTCTPRPGGLFCAWRYPLAQISPRIDELTTLQHGSLVANYRPSVDPDYSDIELPLPPPAAPPQQIRLRRSLSQLLGYRGIWSAVRNCKKFTGSNPHDSLRAELAEAWGDPEQPRDICWNLHVIAERKP